MPNEFDLLFDRYISGVLSTEERTAFLDMIASGSFDNGLNAILDKGLLEQLYAAAAEDRTLGDRIFKNVEREINMQPVHMVPRANRTLILMRWAAAAAIIIFFGIGAYLWNFKKEKSSRIVATETRSADPDILPGRQKAILTLADGSTIILDSAVNGKIAEQNSSSIIKQGDRVTYNSDGTENNDVVYNTMSTPNGGQYQLALSDGTKVWLNAASKITYPAVLNGNKRKVKVEGEVYFEVAPDKSKPFTVQAEDHEIVVLGTSFNINAYNDEPVFKTSLVEGAIKVDNRIVQPGQAYTDGKIIATDIQQDIAWKNGLFSFSNTNLSSFMRQLERWYDIKVLYNGSVPNVNLNGKMYRNVSLSTVLNFLKRTGVKFRMEGKTLVIL